MSALRSRALRSALACALLALVACGERERDSTPAAPPPDEKLELLIPSLVDAVQAKQSKFVMDHVAQSFKEEGGLDYYDVRALVEKFALGDQAVGARLEDVKVTPEGDAKQRVSARVAFALGRRLAPGESLPQDGVVYAIEVLFARNAGVWQAVGGHYKRESPAATSPPVASSSSL